MFYLHSKTNQMHNISNLFYFGTTLYMFRTVFPSIIRSLRLYIQHHTIHVLWLLASKQPQNLHVSDGTYSIIPYMFCGCLLASSHRIYMFRTVFPSIIRSLRLYIQYHTIQLLWMLASKQPQKLYGIYLMLYIQSYDS